MPAPLTAFHCPPPCEHVWDGPGAEWTRECPECDGSGIRFEARPPDRLPMLRFACWCARCNGTGEIVTGESATCSRCGVSAMGVAMMGGP